MQEKIVEAQERLGKTLDEVENSFHASEEQATTPAAAAATVVDVAAPAFDPAPSPTNSLSDEHQRDLLIDASKLKSAKIGV